MLQYEESNLFKEKKFLEGTFKDSLKEMRKVSSFLKTFIKMHQEMRKIYENKDNLALIIIQKKIKKTLQILFYLQILTMYMILFIHS